MEVPPSGAFNWWTFHGGGQAQMRLHVPLSHAFRLQFAGTLCSQRFAGDLCVKIAKQYTHAQCFGFSELPVQSLQGV